MTRHGSTIAAGALLLLIGTASAEAQMWGWPAPSWTATRGGDGGGDWNHARAEYHLDQYPERAFEFPFKMRTGPGSTLQFEVEGRVSVTRE